MITGQSEVKIVGENSGRDRHRMARFPKREEKVIPDLQIPFAD
jgi:hypothetical protein